MNFLQRKIWILITLASFLILAQQWLIKNQIEPFAYSSCSQKWEVEKSYDKQTRCSKSITFEKRSCTSVHQSTRGSFPEVNDFIAADRIPQPLNLQQIQQEIAYPSFAKELNISGTVLVRILVDREGGYVTHRILRPVHPSLSDAVEEKIDELKFKPAVQQGKRVAFWVNIPFRFQLNS
jgi:TonB family protein